MEKCQPITLFLLTSRHGSLAMWQSGRLDLTVEALVLTPPWNSLFTEHELAVARKRLDELGYKAK